MVLKNKYLNTDSKIRIYKRVVRPVTTTAVDTSNNQLGTGKTIRMIHGKTWLEK